MSQPAALWSTLPREELEKRFAARPFWWHQVEVAPGVTTPGKMDTRTILNERIGLPERLDNMSVLDIGAAEGFYSFESERRGADVTAVDRLTAEDSGFGLVRELIGSKAKHHKCSVYNLDPKVLGQFDLVLCLGVVYHLRYPLLAMDVLHAICKEHLILESQICDQAFVHEGTWNALADLSPKLVEEPIAQFYPTDELNNDLTNWWAPNETGLIKMLESSGFEVHLHYSDGVRTVLHARKVKARTSAMQWSAEELYTVRRDLAPASGKRSI